MHPFRKAVENRDMAAVYELLAEDVTFISPVAFAPYQGKPITAAILRGVLRVFEDFRYVKEFGAPGAPDHALMFETTVNGRAITGCDFLHLDADGKIDELMVMVRPLSGATALAEAMGAQFDRIRAEAESGAHSG